MSVCGDTGHTDCQGGGLSLHEAARRFNVPFHTAALPRPGSVQTDELRLRYLEWGEIDAPPVLLLHGIAQQSHSWDFIALGMCHRFRVIALDARGHGDSDWAPDLDYSVDAHQRDLDAVAAKLGLRSFALIGHSMGGRNGYIFAARRPDLVNRLIIVDTGPGRVAAGSARIRRFISLPDKLDSFEQFVERVMDYTGRPEWMVRGSLQHTVKRLPNGKWTWKYDEFIRSPEFRPQSWSTERLWSSLTSLQCPTLLVRGGDSDVLTEDTYGEMLKRIPNCEGVVIADAGHLVPGDKPSEFLQAALRFLNG